MNIFPPSVEPRVLIAPLDWGLGHAARCIPVIHMLQKNNATVWLAAEGSAAQLLKTEFPELPLLPLPGYGIKYGKTGRGTFTALLCQMPKFLRAIRKENKWLEHIVQQHRIDAVISDNRYGLHHPDVYSVFMTHQLLVKSPVPRTESFVQKRLYRYINRFNACWVPDAEGTENIAGALSHPKRSPQIPVTYIGPLSRFTAPEPALPHYLLVLLSGSEPQRTILEEKLLQQAQLFQTPILFVRGLPAEVGVPKVPYHITLVNHLPSAILQKAIESARFVISRCGYSTVMDMLALQKKCIFIPTPMQTEQEYLAKHLMKKNFALCLPQKKFQLKNAVSLAENFPYQSPTIEKTDALQKAVAQLTQAVRSKNDNSI